MGDFLRVHKYSEFFGGDESERIPMWEGKSGNGGELPPPPPSVWELIPAPDPVLDEEGACVGLPQAWWFDYRTTKPESREALRICKGCPVKRKCLEYAMRVPEANDFGIWGGTTKNERQALRTRRRMTSNGR